MSLKSTVQCRIWKPGDPIRPTGIPPHVKQQIQIDKLEKKVDTMSEVIDTGFQTIPAACAESVAKMVEERALQAGQLTIQSCTEIVQGQLDIAFKEFRDIYDTALHGDHGMQSTTPIPSTESQQHPFTTGKIWKDGTIHIVPEDFQVPNGLPEPAWINWVMGRDDLPPYRKLIVRDIGENSDPTKSAKRRQWGHYAYLMGEIEQLVVDAHEWPAEDKFTITQAQSTYRRAFGKLGISPTTPTGRKRRMDQLKVGTIADDLRDRDTTGKKARRGTRKQLKK